MLFTVHIAIVFCIYFGQVVRSVVTFRSIIPGEKAKWRDSAEYRDRSAVPRPPRDERADARETIPHPTNRGPVRRVFVGFANNAEKHTKDTNAAKKGRITTPMWFSLPVGTTVPISFTDRPFLKFKLPIRKKDSDVPLSDQSDTFSLPTEWTTRQSSPISSQYIKESWVRKRRLALEASRQKRNIHIIKAPDAKRSGLPKGQTLEGIMTKLQPGHPNGKKKDTIHKSKTKAKKKNRITIDKPRLSAVQQELEDLDL